jgi:hypothetical protein
VPAAYIQAVSQAIDSECEKIPLKPGDIWEILKNRSREGGEDEAGPPQEAEK